MTSSFCPLLSGDMFPYKFVGIPHVLWSLIFSGMYITNIVFQSVPYPSVCLAYCFEQIFLI